MITELVIKCAVLGLMLLWLAGIINKHRESKQQRGDSNMELSELDRHNIELLQAIRSTIDNKLGSSGTVVCLSKSEVSDSGAGVIYTVHDSCYKIFRWAIVKDSMSINTSMLSTHTDKDAILTAYHAYNKSNKYTLLYI